jgi:hypothetical protein
VSDASDDLADILRHASPGFRKANAHLLQPRQATTPAAAAAVVPTGDDRSEAVWQARVDRLFDRYDWLHYHTHNSKRSPHGYPDCAAVQLEGDQPRYLLAELKTNARTSRPTPAQITWLTRCAAAGLEVYLWRPTDEAEVEQILGGAQPPAEGWSTSWPLA